MKKAPKVPKRTWADLVVAAIAIQRAFRKYKTRSKVGIFCQICRIWDFSNTQHVIHNLTYNHSNNHLLYTYKVIFLLLWFLNFYDVTLLNCTCPTHFYLYIHILRYSDFKSQRLDKRGGKGGGRLPWNSEYQPFF